jgi:uncharacterized protein (TIGR02757 family)
MLKSALDGLYHGFNYAGSAADPVHIVRRYPRVEDREIVAFIGAGLAFGRVASVINSVEAVCAVMGSSPAAFVRRFDRQHHGRPLTTIVHRWIRGADLIVTFVALNRMLASHGSIEAFFAEGYEDAHQDLGPALESFSTRALALASDAMKPGPSAGSGRPELAHGRNHTFFFSRPSTGSACKRLNLFLRWMIRRDGVDLGGWTRIPASKLVIPLDTHTIRVGKCLRLTRRASPGWKMASEITAALRAHDPVDPVRYDFSLCHLSMMGACGLGTKQKDTQCPLRGHCKPGRRVSTDNPRRRT